MEEDILYQPNPYDDWCEDRRVAIAKVLRVIRRANTTWIEHLHTDVLNQYPELADPNEQRTGAMSKNVESLPTPGTNGERQIQIAQLCKLMASFSPTMIDVFINQVLKTCYQSIKERQEAQQRGLLAMFRQLTTEQNSDWLTRSLKALTRDFQELKAIDRGW